MTQNKGPTSRVTPEYHSVRKYKDCFVLHRMKLRYLYIRTAWYSENELAVVHTYIHTYVDENEIRTRPETRKHSRYSAPKFMSVWCTR